MQLEAKNIVKKPQRPQVRMLLWAMLFSAILGVFELGRPIDDALRMTRDRWRAQDASGSIVTVMIDADSTNRFGEWPWPRKRFAALLDALRASGARRVVVTPILSGTTTQEEDRALATALERWNGNAFIASRLATDTVTKERRESLPAPEFARAAQVVNSNLWFNWYDFAVGVPYRMEEASGTPESIASVLSDRKGNGVATIDFSYRLTSIRSFSAVRVMDEKQSHVGLQGKDVVVGVTNDTVNVPGLTRVSSALAHVVAAETLMSGNPLDIGWLPAFLASILFAIAIALGRRRYAIASIAVSLLLMLGLPTMLEGKLIFVSFSPSIVFIGAVTVFRGYLSFRRHDTRVNQVSGLPNLVALRNETLPMDSAVVAMRVNNYAKIAATLPPEREKMLVVEIAHRLGTAGPIKLYQGDEGLFCWVASGSDRETLSDHLDALHAFFLKPVIIDGWNLDVSVAFGVDATSGRETSTRFASAMLAAEEAAATSKRWKYYDPVNLDQAAWNVSLLSRLDSAIESGEVWVAYQPKLNLTSGTIVGLEALVRWSHPERGAISPEEFVLAAEQHGRIDNLTWFVLNDALETVNAAKQRGHDLVIAVNLSVRMLEQPGLVAGIEAALSRHGVSPKSLILEITESAAIKTGVDTSRMLERLALIGVTLSLDDYGTGYSSMAYLKKIRANEVKIDRSFVGVMDHSRSDRILVNSTIDLAHSLGRKVVAEGVENVETLMLLKEMGCDMAQGFHIARPSRVADIWKFLESKDLRRVA
jgi:EAL domain-containing protein (putative c-di-GMP-specific phosphodiesterase class I)/CHASE2 domain-containing sensor protein